MAPSLRWFLTAAGPPPDRPTDAELVRRFASGRDESAFELLVRRHARTVWTACRQVLRADADADDAFQATFLALARHAGAVRAGASVGGWLHRVATNAAVKLKARRPKAGPLPTDVSAAADSTPDADEVSAVHEELARLPSTYRTTLVLVDLEGHTHTDAAKILGWPVGTVSGRLVRARAELKRRLERRGVTVPAVLVGTAVSGSIVRAAVGVAVGTAVAPAVVNSLTNEVIAMLLNAKRKLVAMTAAGLVGVAGLVGTGVVAFAQTPKPEPAKAADKPAAGWNEKDQYPTTIPDIEPKTAKDVEAYRKKLPEVVVLENDPPAVRAHKRLILAGLKQLDIIDQRIAVGQFSGSSEYQNVTQATSNVVAAAGMLWDKPEQLLPWHEWRVCYLKAAELFIRQRAEGALETDPSVYPQLVAERYKAEIDLLKLREKAKK